MKGKVIKSTGSWYTVYSDGGIFQCRTRGKLRLEGFSATNPISVGDEVEFEEEESIESQGLISKILPRRNFITRMASRKSQESQVIAANVDIAAMMVTLFNPRTSLGFIDRFTVSAESFRIPVTLIFNKIDLLKEKDQAEMEEMIEMYTEIGFRCFKISAKNMQGLDLVMDHIHNNVTLLAGHSGVGKSTLLNAISDTVNQKTAEVSAFSTKGVHTTTFAEMFEVRKNTFIIDTPGIKEFGLYDIEEFELSDYFPEMRARKGACKFHNCTHNHEPGCAIKESVSNGTINEKRYKSYLSMLRNEDTRK